MPNLLEMTGIQKAFSGVPVLKGVDFFMGSGEVHALLGENGAGKSTLMNILTGVIPMDAGRVTFDGEPLENITIPKSEAAGIAFVHQELNLINDLRAYENIFLNRELTGRFGHLRKKEMADAARALFADLGVEIDPQAMVEKLKTSEKQLLEIAKALFCKAKLIILDEPTTALNNDEIAHLFRILRDLKAKGTSFIFISHKMPEIFEIADRYTVLRNGVFIQTGNIADITPTEITKLMVGGEFFGENNYQVRELGAPALELDGFSGPGFSDVSLTVRRGEILGVTGLQGSGSSEFMRCAFGDTVSTGGTLKINGAEVKAGSIHRAMQAKAAMLPADRKENSVVPDMTLLENMYLSEHTLSAWDFPIRVARERAKYDALKESLDIKAANPDLLITSLSGGNQQKVFLARWLNTNAEILFLDNPTQGIDVGAKTEIYRLILQLAQQGKTILVNTLEIPELQQVADRCAIFYEGRIIKVLPHAEIEEHTVMLYSTNAVNAKEAD
ncbi:MAG: sugar ABC transporter ATP-binding protein [Oscillibacter sp.]|nr:sugar ABC transporter ATP-binding protein [Oscillibacter sp.]